MSGQKTLDYTAYALNMLSGAANLIIGCVLLVVNIISASLAPALLAFYLGAFGLMQIMSQWNANGTPKYSYLRLRFGFLYTGFGYWAFLLFVGSLGISFVRTDETGFSLAAGHFIPFCGGCFTMFVSALYLGKALCCRGLGYEEVQ